MKQGRLIFLLTFLCFIGVVGGIPYVNELIREEGNPDLIWIFLVQSTILAFLASWIGVRLSAQTGLDVPVMRWLLYRNAKPEGMTRKFFHSVLLGLGIGLLIIMADTFIFSSFHSSLGDSPVISPWKGLAASLYGGIFEEVLCRFLVMNLIVWLLIKLSRKQARSYHYWMGIIFSALFFGIFHLEATSAAFGSLTVPLILRATILNGIPGVLFGWLFWRWGLSYAMLAHLCTDLFLHVIWVALI
ncbi:hypothetical protein GCM10007416_10200 [Kroppenstedtia guangzhouensis]|uniref:CAAX prenyl protease 2/Lysostaphin resistance protein A-like domain-containing protein n=1 Tax=Kroppenstedtia guangzhouensis TaxID=1274356 RepID=A0ABQ1G956_9BACL|nr:CPBP family intramembrane glutamic endopeptidase [Kroppenstedtia guangzhouensis]GGA39178.1 hypothetical protein GCM10007416_10200 [Kroppenstedtia guangzhouensis]